jgi:hypothetical protein
MEKYWSGFFCLLKKGKHEGCQPMYNFQEVSDLMTNIIKVTKGYLCHGYQIKVKIYHRISTFKSHVSKCNPMILKYIVRLNRKENKNFEMANKYGYM